MPPSRVQLAIGGMWINVYGMSELFEEEKKEAVVLFFLHGRFGSAERIEHIVHKTYDDAATSTTSEQATSSSGNAQRALLIVTIDHRNHGTRKISAMGQQSWTEGNMKHAQDMLAMQSGTAQDVSFLADFLPSFLFPEDEVQITKWAVTGISLGGHSVWIVLKQDSRFEIGVPILGCPSYRVLMKQRAEKAGLSFGPPYMPKSLLSLLDHLDPDSANYTSTDSLSNPYLGKKILVLHGGNDELVPWDCCKTFVDGLEVGPEGEKNVFIEQDRGHETSSLMVSELVKWIVKYGVQSQRDNV